MGKYDVKKGMFLVIAERVLDGENTVLRLVVPKLFRSTEQVRLEFSTNTGIDKRTAGVFPVNDEIGSSMLDAYKKAKGTK